MEHNIFFSRMGRKENLRSLWSISLATSSPPPFSSPPGWFEYPAVVLLVHPDSVIVPCTLPVGSHSRQN